MFLYRQMKPLLCSRSDHLHRYALFGQNFALIRTSSLSVGATETEPPLLASIRTVCDDAISL